MPRMCCEETGLETKLYDAIDSAPGYRVLRQDLVGCLRGSADVGFTKPIREVAKRTSLICRIYALTQKKVLRRTGSASFYFR